uniref:DNA polymerase epsilon subunit 2 n=1 Tax=Sarcophilus harrisii TaxID=9305 RepID=A0A7N4V062_SARHA
ADSAKPLTPLSLGATWLEAPFSTQGKTESGKGLTWGGGSDTFRFPPSSREGTGSVRSNCTVTPGAATALARLSASGKWNATATVLPPPQPSSEATKYLTEALERVPELKLEDALESIIDAVEKQPLSSNMIERSVVEAAVQECSQSVDETVYVDISNHFINY